LVEVEAALPMLEQIDLLRYDSDTQMIWIVNYALRNLGRIRSNDKKGAALANAEYAAIPEHCPMRLEFLATYGDMLRLDVDASAVPNGASFETEAGVPPDLISESLPAAGESAELSEPAI
jgi:hypothetical protein